MLLLRSSRASGGCLLLGRGRAGAGREMPEELRARRAEHALHTSTSGRRPLTPPSPETPAFLFVLLRVSSSSVLSGGVSRDWAGVPRKLYKPGATEPHCVCVRTTGPPSDQAQGLPAHTNRGDLDHPNLGEYAGCPPLAVTCSFPPR